MVLPLIAAGIGGVASIIGSRSAARTQANAAEAAAKAQAKAARETNKLLGGWRREDIARLDPYARSGTAGQNALAFELGLGPRPDGYAGFQASPGYQFAMDQGREAVEGSVAARNGLNSGAALAELTRFGQGLANQEYGNFFNRLSGMADTGFRAVSGQSDVGQRYGNAIANNMLGAGQSTAEGIANAGNARAAGTVGGVNAFNSAIGQGIGVWQNQRLMDRMYPMNNAFAGQPNGTPGQGMW